MAFQSRKNTDTDAATGTINVLSPQNNQAVPQPQETENAPQTTGQSAQIEGQTSPNQPAPLNKASASSGFTNIRKYLAGSERAAKDIAGKAIGSAESQVADVKSGIEQNRADYQKKVADIQKTINQQQKSGFATVNPNIRQSDIEASKNAEAGSGYLDYVRQAQEALNPTSENVYKTQEWKGPETQYSAPEREATITQPVALTTEEYINTINQAKNKEFSQQAGQLDLTAQQAEAEKLQGLAKEVQSSSGRFNLLNKFFANKPEQKYTSGMQLLDASIIQQNKDERQRLMQGVGEAIEGEQGSTKALEAAKTFGTEQQAALTAKEQELQQSLSGIASGAEASWQQELTDRALAEQTKRNELANALKTAMADNVFTADELTADQRASLGLDAFKNVGIDTNAANYENAEEFNKLIAQVAADRANQGLSGVDLKNYIDLDALTSGNDDLLSMQSRLTQTDEASKLKALAALQQKQANINDTLVGQGLGNIADAYNKQGLQTAIENKLQGTLEPYDLKNDITNRGALVDRKWNEIWNSSGGGDWVTDATSLQYLYKDAGVYTPEVAQVLSEYEKVFPKDSGYPKLRNELSHKLYGMTGLNPSDIDVKHKAINVRASTEIRQQALNDLLAQLGTGNLSNAPTSSNKPLGISTRKV